MSADKRKVSTDALETLGTLIDENQKRDAIHLAVIPAIAGQDLAPGSHVDVESGIAKATGVGLGVGIIDPFLKHDVRKGQRFWLVIYPRQITSLRHVWTHPAFPEESAQPEVKQFTKEESEAWLRNFCEHADCPGYDDTIAVALGENPQLADSEWYGASTNDGEYLFFSGRDGHGDIPPEFWDHLEVVSGKKIPPHMRARHFSCSC